MAKLLDGILVLDFSRVLAGPFCTMTLADLGARVIKVEAPTGDEARGMGPFVDGHSLYFASINRGKQSVGIDLKHADGRALAQRLADRADVLVENFRPGAMRRLGLSYDRVRESNPRIIYASLSGFGQEGPYSDRGAYDVIIQAMGGLMGITGQEGGNPTRVGASVGDLIPALYTVTGILAALHRRATTGEGCHLDMAMMDCAFAVVENALARYWVSGVDPEPIGNRHPAITPFSTFATHDGEIVIACGNDALWQRLCASLGAPRLAEDPRFATNPRRTENVAPLTRELERILVRRSTDAWLRTLLADGIPCAKVNRMSDLVADENLRRRNMLVELEQPGVGRMPVPGTPIKATGHDDAVGRSAPELAADTRAVLSDLLGLESVRLDELERSGAIAGGSREGP